MTLLRLLAKRVAMGVATAWIVLSVVFTLFTRTDDWVLEGEIGLQRLAGVSDEEALEQLRAEYFAERGLDRPFHEQYLDWLGNMLTLEWGNSWATGEAVLPLVIDAAVRTLTYAVPAIVLAIVCGVLIGVYAALNPRSRLASGGVGSSYVLFAVPNFWIGGMILSLVYGNVIRQWPLLFEHLLPIALAFSGLLAGYVSYARAHSREYASAEFVTLVKAKGASPFRVATHVVRNSAIPFVSLLFTEALGLLVLATFVIEVLFGIEGFGLLLLEAVDSRDLPVLLGGTVLIIGAGIVGNVVQDVAYGYLDPRVAIGE